MTTLKSDLQRLSEPPVPEGFGANIRARIARLDDERPNGEGQIQRVDSTEARRHRFAWGVSSVGAAIGLGAQTYRLAVGEVTLNLMSLRAGSGTDGVVEMLPASPAVAALVFGLGLCLVGLFGALRDQQPAIEA